MLGHCIYFNIKPLITQGLFGHYQFFSIMPIFLFAHAGCRN